MVLTLPLPNAGLSPNSRLHWRSKNKLTAQHRSTAYWLTLLEVQKLDVMPPMAGYRLAFYWATKRRRDDDNAAAMCKAYRDGIAEALGVDDSTLKMHGPVGMECDRLRPRLEITLLGKAEIWKAES
jgi:hypothetical protein